MYHHHSLVWSFSVFLFFSITFAQQNQLTSTTTFSCGGSGISITNFGLVYFRSNRSLEFAMTASALQSNLQASVHVDVTAYGIKAPTQVIDLCAITNCPLSSSATLTRGSQILDQSYGDKLPNIAWAIPDIDATATFTFISTSDSSILACISSTLSNGVTAQHSSASWATGATTVIIGAVGLGVGIAHFITQFSTAGVPQYGGGGGGGGGGAEQYANNATSTGGGASGGGSQIQPGHLKFGESGGGTSGGAGGGPSSGPTGNGSNAIWDAALPAGAAGVTAPATAAALVKGGAQATGGGGNEGTVPENPQITDPIPRSAAPISRIDATTIFLHFQHISSTGLLSLNYPPIFQAFTSNFAWANFLIPIGAINQAATNMRSQSSFCQSDSASDKSFSPSSLAVPAVKSPSAAPVPGIGTYCQRLGVDPDDVFGVFYLMLLIICAIALLVLFLGAAVLQVMGHFSEGNVKKDAYAARLRKWREMSSNNILRLITLSLSSLATFSFYQWTRKCGGKAALAVSVLTLLLFLATITAVSFFILRLSRQPGGLEQLFNRDSIYGKRWGSMYDTLLEQRISFFVPLLVVVIVRSAITGFGQGHGLGQVCALMVIELIECMVIFHYKPYYSRGYNKVNYLIYGNKFVLLLLFVDTLGIKPIPTTVIGILLILVNSLVALMLLVLTILKLGWGILWYRRKHFAFEKKSKVTAPFVQPVDRKEYEPPMVAEDLDGRKINI